MTDISKQYIKELIGPGAVILEIGSYNLKDGIELAEVCETTVHCFEPNPASFQVMRLMVDNRPKDDLILWNYAVCGHDGFAMLNLSNHPQSDTLKVPKLHKKIWPKIKYKHQVKVKCTTLDSWNWSVRKGEPVDFIWTDVNGAEASVLLGGAKTLSKTRYIYLEYCEKELFDKALNRANTIKALPGFEVIGDYNFQGNFGNLLMKNKTL